MLMKIIFWTSVLYLTYCFAVYFLQRQILFPIRMLEKPPAPVLSGGIEQRKLSMPFGTVEAWFMPAEGNRTGPPAPAVLFAHGNGELIDYWPAFFTPLTQIGVGVLLVEYPGYGRSEGTPSQETIRETFAVAHEWLLSRPDVDRNRIILMGRSLGGGAVCSIAGSHDSCAMILMSAFTGVRAYTSKYLLPPFCIRDPFDNLTAVSKYSHPLLVVHGRNDQVVPYSHGRRLHQAAITAELITYESDHNDCPPDARIFWRDVEKFLYRHDILPDVRTTDTPGTLPEAASK
ncbi:MAG: alpha/beta hydrolase [Thermodesulfobacteriota bacterium]